MSPLRRLSFALASLAVPALPTLAAHSPAVADAAVDLRTTDGAAAAHAEWRFAEARVVSRGQTHDIAPRINTPEYDTTAWTVVAPAELESRRTAGGLSFGWYRLDFTIPERIGSFETSGSTVVLELVVDDYAEIWIDGQIPLALGQTGGSLIAGWNAPNRVTITRQARPETAVHVAVFAANGPISDPPANRVWIRSATLDFYRAGHSLDGVSHAPATVLRASAALDSVLEPGVSVERVAEGFVFTEGPVWAPSIGAGGSLLFSDPNQNVIHRWSPSDGAVTVFRTKSGGTGGPDAALGERRQPGSNGLALDPQGRLIICEHGNRRVTRLEPNGAVTVLADRFEGRRLNSPNDLVVRSDGTVFFTDPPFGLPRGHDDPRKELPFSGVFCLKDGQLRLLNAELRGPNGIALSPDEKTLYVSNWDEQRKVVMSFDLASDGALSGGTVFLDLTHIPGEICFDGLEVDSAGNLYIAGPDGLRVHAPSGAHLGTIELPELPANFAFGDADRRTLYVAARTSVYCLRVLVPGMQR